MDPDPGSSGHSLRSRVWAVSKLVLGVVLLALVLWRGGPTLAVVVLTPVRIGPLLLALLFGVAAPVCTFLRWHWLAHAQELGIPLRESWRLGCLGYFWGTVLPGSLGGDIVKAGLLARDPDRRVGAIASILMDRVIGLFGLFLLAGCVGVVTLIFAPDDFGGQVILWTLVVGAMTLSGAGLATVILARLLPDRAGVWVGKVARRLPLVGRTMAALWQAGWLYRSRLRVLAGAVLLSVVGHIGFILNFYFTARMFHQLGSSIPTVAQHFLIIPAGQLFGSVFPTPGGLGGAEFGFGQLYVLLGKPETNGVLGALAVRAITWGICLVGALIWSGTWIRRSANATKTVPFRDDGASDSWTQRRLAG